MMHRAKKEVNKDLTTQIYDTGMQLKGRHPIRIILQGDAEQTI